METVNKIHSYIEYETEKIFDQNDIIVLNVYNIKYIEMIVFMFQNFIDNITIHLTLDMNQFLIRVLKSFKANQVLNGFIPKWSMMNSKDPQTEMGTSLGTDREEDIKILNEYIIK